MRVLSNLDEDALIEILTKPKNALVKQYQKMLELDDVEFEFEEDALREIAKKAIERKTGARGLRSIIEGIMLDVMFDLPSRDDIAKCIITKDARVLENSVSKASLRRWNDYCKERNSKTFCLIKNCLTKSDKQTGFHDKTSLCAIFNVMMNRLND